MRKLWLGSPSVADCSFLGGVDVGGSAGLEEESTHVLRQEGPGLRVHHIEAVMIDQHRLLLEPVCPALGADLFDDAGPDWSRKWRFYESGARLTTARAGY
ncbi:MAG: hypothetical protein QOK07_3190 [Gemmatimonadaceae bacterium]|nr:hypothetical protein [Gemmatimonadaceae bacterium]